MKKRVTNWVEFDDPIILRKVLNDYFDEQDEAKLPYTISGICLQVGCRRKTLLQSIPDTPIGALLYQARMLIEQQHEIHLLTTKRPAGVVFALKNLGWSESSRLDVGFSPSTNDKEAMKWTIEVVAPGQLSESSVTSAETPKASAASNTSNTIKQLPAPASKMTLDMIKPLRDSRPDAPDPWFVSEFEATLEAKKELFERDKRRIARKEKREMKERYKHPMHRPDYTEPGKMILDISLKKEKSAA